MYFTCYVQRLSYGINHCVEFLLRRIYKTILTCFYKKLKDNLKDALDLHYININNFIHHYEKMAMYN